MSMSYLGGTGATIASSWAATAQEKGFWRKLGSGVCSVFDTVTAPVQGVFNIGYFDGYENALNALDKLCAMKGAKPYSENLPWYAKPDNLKWIGAASVGLTVAAVVAGVMYAKSKSSEE